MGGLRSKLQCAFKWKNMEGRIHHQRSRLKQSLDSGKALARPETKNPNITMLLGDKINLLNIVANCGVARTSDVPWETLAKCKKLDLWRAGILKKEFMSLCKGKKPHVLSLKELTESIMEEIRGLGDIEIRYAHEMDDSSKNNDHTEAERNSSA